MFQLLDFNKALIEAWFAPFIAVSDLYNEQLFSYLVKALEKSA